MKENALILYDVVCDLVEMNNKEYPAPEDQLYKPDVVDYVLAAALSVAQVPVAKQEEFVEAIAELARSYRQDFG